MLHLGACPGSLPRLLAAKDKPDSWTCEVEMSQTEVLRTQIDNLRLEVQRLGVENARLREERPEAASEIDWESRYLGETGSLAAEIQELRQLLHASQESEAKVVGEAEAMKGELEKLKSRDEDSKIERLENEIQQLTERSQVAEANCEELSEQLERAKDRAELDYYRKLEMERSKWEERELRLVEQLREAQRRSEDTVTSMRTRTVRFETSAPQNQPSSETESSSGSSIESTGAIESTSAITRPDSSDERSASTTGPATVYAAPEACLSAALLAHQLPPISKYSGEDISEGGESFQD